MDDFMPGFALLVTSHSPLATNHSRCKPGNVQRYFAHTFPGFDPISY
jgi:hypothetical protein